VGSNSRNAHNVVRHESDGIKSSIAVILSIHYTKGGVAPRRRRRGTVMGLSILKLVCGLQ